MDGAVTTSYGAERGLRSPAKFIRPLSLLVGLAFLAGCAILILSVRRDAEQQAAEADSNLAAAISQEIEHHLESYDLSLQGVLEALDEPRLATADPKIRKLALFDRSAEAPYLGRIAIIDAQGRMTEVSRNENLSKANFADRDFFRAQRDNPDAGLYVSGPTRSKATGEWIIALSRRIPAQDGGFGGVVVGSLSLDYFSYVFQNLKRAPDDTFTVLTTDGALVMRFPFRMNDIGRDLSAGDLFRFYSKAQAGSYEVTSAVDGVARFYSFKRARNLPLIAVVGSSKERIFAIWRTKALAVGAVMAALSGVVGMLGFALACELRRRRDLEQRLAAAASTDVLTGLPNRRCFEEATAKEWRRAIRSRKPVSLLIIDVDHFKLFNDRHGHQHGDRALSAVAGCVAASMRRPGDLGARYGGEEFVVLLPETSVAGARTVADNIRRMLKQVEFVGPSGVPETIKVSIGVACCAPDFGGAFAALFARADQALYNAKRAGRDRVEIAEHEGVPEKCDAAAP